MEKSEEEWREELTEEEYYVLREAGTEPPGSGELLEEKRDGYYHCGACGAKLFSSEHKYESGSGWPSFWGAEEVSNIELKEDRSGGMVRTEVVCAECGSHLGHLFEDGPEPTGKRYCINSVALKFEGE